MLADIDVKRLRLFKRLVECGGLSAAETALNINLPTISAHLSALEKSLGMRLCDRGRKGFRLTEEGLSVLESCNRLFESIEAFRSDVSRVSQSISGLVRLGVVDNLISDENCRLAQVISGLRQHSRDLELSVDTRNPSDLERLLLEERIDVAIGPFHKSNPGVEELPLYSERISLYVGAAHPLASRKSVQLDDLVGIDYVARGYLRESQVAQQIVSFNTCATAQNIEGIAFMILSGCYVGYLPDHYADTWVRRRAMKKLLPRHFSHSVRCKAITLRGRRKTRAVSTLLGILAQSHA
jgi:LysR family transcriptional regulator, transcriptional activator for bauABCD operon